MMMALHHSGSRKAINLAVIQTAHMTLVMKGKLDYSKYIAQDEEATMHFSCSGQGVESVEIYDAREGKLVGQTEQALYPIFFENGIYEVIIIPKNGEQLTFYHEFSAFREAISRLPYSTTLTGNLHFQNEVGFSTFDILEDNQRLLTVTFEVFPTKLDYKKDYRALLAGVNEEVYNLAYHFIKRTYLQGSAELFREPSSAEFYRLLTAHFEQYERAIAQVERRPHHQLQTCYEEVRGDRLRKQDSRGRAYLRKNAQRFVDVKEGIEIGGRTVMPARGLLMKKQHTTDTHENRYVKFTMERIVSKLEHLQLAVKRFPDKQQADTDLIEQLEQMIGLLRVKLRQPFWRAIGKLDRTINSMVLQMGTGYREVFQVYVTISKSIVLKGELYKMAVKDIATLYEYWTFLKLGRILESSCDAGEQDVIQLTNNGLFLNLKQNQRAVRHFVHKTTGEKITLCYQYSTGKKIPTVTQKPDSMLSITKTDKDYSYEYIFDAKYRIEVRDGEAVGPKEEDINTMHRYRDSIVVERAGAYERRAFGAYVLFPWHDEVAYVQHPLYESINTVNIGGLPFLPNSTTLVEKIIDSLLNKTADELQQQGILPIGARGYEYEVKAQEVGAYVAAEVVDKDY